MPTKTKNENSATETPQDDAQETAERTDAMTLGPNDGGNAVFAAWRGAVNLFGAQVERFDYVPGEGVVAVGLTFNGGTPAETLIADLSRRGDKVINRRLDFTELYPYFNGETPEPYLTSDEMTQWMVQFLKGSGDGDGSRSPQYAKDAIASYKAQHNIAAPRGRRRKLIRLDKINDIKVDSLLNVEDDELTQLRNTIEQALALRANSGEQTASATS